MHDLALDSRLPTRFWDKVLFASSGCWLWTGHVASNGYGRYHTDGRFLSAHRHAFSRLVSSIPAGMYADHVCCTRKCVNPEHLDIVTHQENIRRAGWRKTKCKNGHDYTPDNTYIRPDGRNKDCRICRRARMRKHKERSSI